MDIKYISFSTWGASSVRFFYDCPGDDGQEIFPVERKLTTQETLLHNLLHDYDSFQIPQSIDEIMVDTFTIKTVDYNEQKSLLTTKVQVKLSWNDSKLAWDPILYDDIKGIRNPARSNFWKPSLMLLK